MVFGLSMLLVYMYLCLYVSSSGLYTSHLWAQVSSHNEIVWAAVPTRTKCGMGTSLSNCFAEVWRFHYCGFLQRKAHGKSWNIAPKLRETERKTWPLHERLESQTYYTFFNFNYEWCYFYDEALENNQNYYKRKHK